MRFDIDALISLCCLIVSIAIVAILFGGWRMNLNLLRPTTQRTFVEAPVRPAPQRQADGYVESRTVIETLR